MKQNIIYLQEIKMIVISVDKCNCTQRYTCSIKRNKPVTTMRQMVLPGNALNCIIGTDHLSDYIM